jgi:hypothetical protein
MTARVGSRRWDGVASFYDSWGGFLRKIVFDSGIGNSIKNIFILMIVFFLERLFYFFGMIWELIMGWEMRF